MKCIVFCSGKGGTGKSCVAAYTGVALAAAGMKTLILEPESGGRSLDLILDARDGAFFIEDVLAGRCDPEEAAVTVENAHGLRLICSNGLPGRNTREPARFQKLLRELDPGYDFVLIDAPDLSDIPIAAVDRFLMVLTPDSLCLRACSQLTGDLFASGARDVRLVINNVPARIVPMEGAEDFDDIIDKVGAQLIGVIPASPKLHYCANNARQLDPDSITVKIFDNLARRLMGQRRPLLIR